MSHRKKPVSYAPAEEQEAFITHKTIDEFKALEKQLEATIDKLSIRFKGKFNSLQQLTQQIETKIKKPLTVDTSQGTNHSLDLIKKCQERSRQTSIERKPFIQNCDSAVFVQEPLNEPLKEAVQLNEKEAVQLNEKETVQLNEKETVQLNEKEPIMEPLKESIEPMKDTIKGIQRKPVTVTPLVQIAVQEPQFTPTLLQKELNGEFPAITIPKDSSLGLVKDSHSSIERRPVSDEKFESDLLNIMNSFGF